MKAGDIHGYLARDWEQVRASKDRYWAERKRTLSPEEALEQARGQSDLRPVLEAELDRLG